ncbi:hypothetical protein HanOQP8_Chr01g0035511 [Helianthus annuus]|nr:hypothetical protein HanOQP8_Chr01g0035511 [Helianthus annuus]
MESYSGTGGVPAPLAIIACIGMTILYVAILYSPTLILRLPPPSSFKTFMIRRFICAGISTVISLVVCAFILPLELVTRVLLFVIWGFGYFVFMTS